MVGPPNQPDFLLEKHNFEIYKIILGLFFRLLSLCATSCSFSIVAISISFLHLPKVSLYYEETKYHF